MKETKLYHTALDRSLLNGKKARAALDERIAKEPVWVRDRNIFPWQKALMTAAAMVVLLIATVMAIPSFGSFQILALSVPEC